MSSNEVLEVYDSNGNYTGLSTRDKFKNDVEAMRKGATGRKVSKNTKQVKRVVAFIMTSEGRILLQKRAHDKKENPGLFDKTIGGHTTYLDSSTMRPGSLDQELSDFNAVKECIEELGIPTTSLSNGLFKDAIVDIKGTTLGVITRIERVMGQESRRVYQEGPAFIQPYITDAYIGYYDGSYRFRDGEARGLDTFTIQELEATIKRTPRSFTDDVRYMVGRYGRYLVGSDTFRARFEEDGNQFILGGLS